MKRLLTILLIFCCFQVVRSQVKKSVCGVVYSDSAAVELAHVFLKSGLVGTITAYDGSFCLYVDSVLHANDTLVFSSIGFKKVEWPLANVDDTLKVRLVQLPRQLNEVVVLPADLTPALIVRRAFRQLNNNLGRAYYMDGFWRWSGFSAGNARLIEAALGFSIKGKEFNRLSDQVAAYEVRSSNNKMEEMSWGAKALHKAMRLMSGNELPVNEFYDVLRIVKPKHFSSHKDWMDSYDFDVKEAFLEEDSSYTYSIAFKGIVGPICGEFIINSKDWKLLAQKTILKEESLNGRYDNIPLSSEVRYQEINSKMYPLYIEHKVLGGGNSAHTITTEDGKEVGQYHKSFLFVNFIDPKMRKYRKDFKSHLVDPQTPFEPSLYPYNASFWRSYNMLKLNPQDQKVIEELSQDIPLEQQFIDNGKQL